VVGGLICGLLGAAASSVILRSRMPVGRFDLVVYLSVGALLACAGRADSYVPVRRATAIDPVRVLRCE
jgi:hypothetical protein